MGVFRDSGFRTPPYLVRRADGHPVQLPEILYRVAEAANGRHGYAELARRVSGRVGRRLTAEDVRFLAERRLRPLGVLAAPDGSCPPLRKPDPLLALRFRAKVVPARIVRALTTLFRPLYRPPVVLAVIVAFLALDTWLLGFHGVAPGVRAALYRPQILIAMFGAVVLGTAFHELGHATACRYGGAEPGVVGVGIYLVWPAFYTDVTDAYRLDRRGRLRTDLGGVYFNAIFALVAAGAFFATGLEPLLLLVVIQTFAIVQQLLPLLRLDGYYILTDLTGVPDLLGRLRPILASLIPWRTPDPGVSELKPWVRWAATVYVLALVPILGLSFAAMAMAAPRVLATAWDSVGVRSEAVAAQLRSGETLRAAAGALQICALMLPALGLVYSSGRFGRRAQRTIWSRAGETRVSRATLAALAAACIFVLWPDGQYRVIGLADRGSAWHALRSLRPQPDDGRRPARARDRARARAHGDRSGARPSAQTVAAATPPPPGAQRPRSVRRTARTPADATPPKPAPTGTDSSPSPRPSSTPAPRSVPSPTATPTPTAGAIEPPTASPTPSASPTPTASASPSPTPSPSPSATESPSATPTLSPSATPTQASIPTPTPTP